MRKIIISVAMATFLALGINPLYAGSGHSHGEHGHSHEYSKVGEAQAKQIAMKQLNGYVALGKLDKSWKNISVKNTNKQEFQGTPEWVFTFNNPNEPKADQKNLYIFINQYGQMTGANFTGK
ncbi:hypothetical protein HUE87_10215 [Candidatus Sulfurimonas marisnigri]|uniref:PepSY domain-containing protein n=1 Tax=Candidatus Sulfurimonas marisnigri TaxID=2740405 RepID=A0A7S7LZC4_9BACT|nr:DUF6488 family protein [Candidatus Sulfurimonas marisnigri]QOY54242.1 hypothetical protein HUE87_10215 [Candidatus Sulfurimonas marisnigri]